jgi:hypothetical protein
MERWNLLAKRLGDDPVMKTPCKGVLAVAVILCLLLAQLPARAYSVLTHEANIDSLWESAIQPLLKERFPAATQQELIKARGYAYGGCIIQDLGYYPFGSKFFSNLLHYVRTGDFVEAMIHNSQDLNEYAFALGSLAHYSADNTGHSLAVNRSVALMYPQLRAKYGDVVTYSDDKKSHTLVEFSFDVVQVASGAYLPDTYHNFIGFEVSKPLLERVFREIYGLQMKDVFFSEDLAIGIYRHSVSHIIPQTTRVAWSKKHDEIEKLKPGVKRKEFVFHMSHRRYHKEFRSDYEHIGFFARFLGLLYEIVPRIGPFRAFGFKTPTPQAENLFLESFKNTRELYRQNLEELRAGQDLNLTNTDFDTGQQAQWGEYPLADRTYAQLVDKLSKHKFAGVPQDLCKDIEDYYASPPPPPAKGVKPAKLKEKTRQQLQSLKTACAASPHP